MSIIGKMTEEQLRGLLLKHGVEEGDLDQAVADVIKYLLRGYNWEEAIFNDPTGGAVKSRAMSIAYGLTDLVNNPDIIRDIVSRYGSYKKSLEKIRESYQATKDWDSVITTVVYSDDNQSQEAFIDLIETLYQVKILSAEQLQDLTGITQESLEGLAETLYNCRISRYKRGLSQLIRTGGSYQDLLSLDPESYQLPVSIQGETIREALISDYCLNETSFSALLPDIRTIADDLQAPYSVLLDAFLSAQRY